MPSTSAWRLTRVEIVTMRVIPAARARATTASSSPAKSGKSRWQWLSISIGPALSTPFALNVAGKDRTRRRQRRAGGDPARPAQHGELPLGGRHGEQVEQFGGRGRHERLR